VHNAWNGDGRSQSRELDSQLLAVALTWRLLTPLSLSLIFHTHKNTHIVEGRERERERESWK
jgi:hypothetical protein